VGLALGAGGILLELGLDQVVGVAPWLVVAFGAGLLAAILGGPVGGALAALIGAAGQIVAIPAWVPAVRRLDGAGWELEAGTAVVARGVGLALRRLVLSVPLVPSRAVIASAWASGTDPDSGLPWRGRADDRRATARPDPALASAAASAVELAITAAAIRDLGAVRTSIQVADALGRHAAALSGATFATVYLSPDGLPGLVAVGRAGGIDPEAPERIALESVDRGARPDDGAPPSGRSVLVPIALQTVGQGRVLGAIRLAMGSGAMPTLRASPLLPVVIQLAADALERVRLDAARRTADEEAAGAGRRLAILGRLALELVGGRTIDEVATTLLAFAVDDLGAGFAAVHVATEGDDAFRLAASRGLPAGLIAVQAEIAADTIHPVTAAATSREPVEIAGEDGWRAAFPRTSNVPAITGARSISAIPMVAGDAVRGVLTIGWRTVGDRPAAERGIIAAAAAQGAQALERAILHAHDEDARRFQEAFIGVVSHELRTPITTILAGSRLLRRRLGRDPAAIVLSDDIVIEADRLTRIVDDLLVLSRLERRHLTIGDDPVHLDHLLARVIRSESARWPGHAFDVPASPNRHVVLGEETYVEQVLRNLISNAAKYSPLGSTIQVAIDDTAGGDVEVRVLDQGPGVAPGEVDELFSLFYRSPTTAASAAGAGIGLFVSRQLVTEMGGRVWARPRPEGGSEFGFSLAPYPIDELEPDDDGEPPPAPAVIASARSESADPESGGGGAGSGIGRQ
jgi:signal transduction histidine kinase